MIWGMGRFEVSCASCLKVLKEVVSDMTVLLV